MYKYIFYAPFFYWCMQLTSFHSHVPTTIQPLIQEIQTSMVDAACTCDGAKWQDDRLTMTSGSLSQSIFCGKEYTIKCSTEYAIAGQFLCGTPDCNVAKYLVQITDPSGGISTLTVAGSALNYTLATKLNGTYTVVVSPVCGDKICSPCTISFVSSGCAAIANTSCECGDWKSLALKTAATNTTAATSTNLKCDGIYPIDCKKSYTFFAEYACKTPNCVASYKATLTVPGGVTYNLLTSSTGNLSHTFTPVTDGDYVLNITPICGDKACTPCKIILRVTNCAATCVCGKWSDMTMKLDTSKLLKPLVADNQYKANCNKPVAVAAKYNCQATGTTACDVKYDAYLLSPSGVSTPVPASSGTFGYTFTPTTNGTYLLIIQPICGGTKCEPIKFGFYVNDCVACACGTWQSSTLKNVSTGTSAFAIKNGDAYDLGCNKSYSISATFKCEGPCGVVYNAAMISSTGITTPIPAPAGGAFNHTFTLPTNGSYTLLIEPVCGDKKCEPFKITFNVRSCISADCGCGSWKSLDLKRLSGTVPLKTDTVYAVKCNEAFALSGQYKCKGTICNVKYFARLILPDGTIMPSVTSDSIFKPSFIPDGNGICRLEVTPICGKDTCKTNTYRFDVKDCIDPNAPIVCKCGKWGVLKTSVPNVNSTLPPITQDIQCGGTYKAQCGTPTTIKALYACEGTNCAAKYKSSLITPTGIIAIPNAAGALEYQFTPNGNGVYTLVIEPTCGDAKCEPCKINFVVNDCVTNCKCGKWGDFTWSSAIAKPSKLACNGEYEASCKQTYNIAANYQCAGDSTCKAKYNAYMITPLGVAVPIISTSSSAFNYAFTPTTNGAYTLVVEPVCGTNKCEPCKIRFVVKDCVPVPPACACGKWGSFKWGIGGAAATDLVCGKEYIAKCKQTYNINAQYLCVGDNCTAKYNAFLISPTGATTTLAISSASTLTTSFTPIANGTYTLVVEPTCGTNKCEPCRVFFKVQDCGVVPVPTTDCCKDTKLEAKSGTLTYINATYHTLKLNGFNLVGIAPTDIASFTTSIVSAKTSGSTCNQNGVAAAYITGVPTNTTGLISFALGALSREVTFTNGNFNPSGNIALALNIPLQKDCSDTLEVCVRFEVKKKDCSGCVFYQCFKVNRKFVK
jgi:hypothetical protein